MALPINSGWNFSQAVAGLVGPRHCCGSGEVVERFGLKSSCTHAYVPDSIVAFRASPSLAADVTATVLRANQPQRLVVGGSAADVSWPQHVHCLFDVGGVSRK